MVFSSHDKDRVMSFPQVYQAPSLVLYDRIMGICCFIPSSLSELGGKRRGPDNGGVGACMRAQSRDESI